MGNQTQRNPENEENNHTPVIHYYWKYDDGKYQVCTIQGGKTQSDLLENKLDLDDMKQGGGNFVKLDIENGLKGWFTKDEVFNSPMRDLSYLSPAFSDMMQVVEDYSVAGNATEVIRLITYLLSGYTFRLFMNQLGKRGLFSFRAPVVYIIPHKSDFCEGFEHLEHLTECFSYDTSHDSAMIHMNPAVLPDNYLASETIECAFMQISDMEECGFFPAQYRDTSVLLHSRFFKKSDWTEFVNRNVWATVLIFGGPAPKDIFPCLEVDLNCFNLNARNWDETESKQVKDRIQTLVMMFAKWLHVSSRTQDFSHSVLRWTDVGALAVGKYNLAISRTNRPILQGSLAHYHMVQMATLRAFLDFCLNKDVIDKETADTTWDGWANEILPGSREAEIYYKKESERLQKEVEEKEEWRRQCEALFRGFLESATDDMIVKRTDVDWKSFKKDKYYRDRYSVFVDYHDARKTNEGFISSVKIFRADLQQYNIEHGRVFEDVIKDMWNGRLKTVLPYVYTCDNLNFHNGVQGQGIVLRMDKLSFLNSECLEMLREELGPEKRAKKSR